MKNSNLKITPISLALLGGLSVIPTVANADNSRISVEETGNTSDSVTYDYVYHDIKDGYDPNMTRFFMFEDKSKLTLNVDDPRLRFIRGTSMGHPGALGVLFATEETGSKIPKEGVLNIKNFGHISNGSSKDPTGVLIRTIVYDANQISSVVNTDTKVTGDNKRVIEAIANDIFNDHRGYTTARAFSSTYWTEGSHKILFDAPNTTYKVSAINTHDEYTLIGINQGYYNNNNQVDLEFKSGNVEVNGSNSAYAYGLYSQGARHRGKGPVVKTPDSYFNLKVSGGSIIAKDAKYVNGIASIFFDIKGYSNVHIDGGEIKVQNAKHALYGVYVRPKITKEDNLEETKEASIEQSGGKVIVDGAVNSYDEDPTIIGFYLAAGGSDAKATVAQSKGLLSVTNANQSSKESFGVYASAKEDVKFTQGSEGVIQVSGNNTTVADLESYVNNIQVDVAGSNEAKDKVINARTQAGKLSTINIHSTAKLFADTAVYNNNGDSLITVAKGAIIGKANQQTKFDLGEGNDKLTINGVNLEHITELDGGQDTNVKTDFDTLVLNDYQNLDLANRLKNWERVELHNGSYQLSSSLTTGKGVFSDQVGGLVIEEDAQLGFVANKEITIDGDILNNNRGLINLRLNGDGEFAKVVVNGDYHGNGGKLAFNTALNGDDSLTDRITFNGQVSGTTVIEVANKGGQGAETVKGIQLIKLGDSGNANADAFVLDSSTVAKVGDYEYKTLSFSDTDNKGFFLKSTKVEPVVVPDPAPKDPTPKDPDPKNPSPKNPDPVTPAPIDPSPADPITPAPVDPVPVAPTPVAPTPSIPDVVDPTVIPGSSENSNVTDVINSKDSTNLDVEDYAVAYRSGQALTAFNSSDLFYDHKNDQGFNVGFFSRASTAKGYYNRLVLSYGESQYRTSISINYGKGGWKNPNSTGTSSSKILGFTGEIAYRHADNFNYALYLDYSNSDSKVHRDYAIAGKAHQSIQNLKSNNLELSLRLSKDFDYANSILTPYFLMAYQHNAIKGFNEQFNLSAPVKSYHGLELAVPKQSFDLIRPEVGIIATHKLGSGLEFKGALYYSFLPETDFKASILGRKDTGETEVLNNDYSYKADHLFATRLALVKYFSNKLSIKAEGQLNKVTSLKGLTGSLELSLRYDF